MAIVTLVSPSTLENIGRHTPIVLQVEREENESKAFIWIEYDYGTEVVFSTDGFARKFAPLSTTDGGDPTAVFSIRRSGGWLKDPIVHVDVGTGYTLP